MDCCTNESSLGKIGHVEVGKKQNVCSLDFYTVLVTKYDMCISTVKRNNILKFKEKEPRNSKLVHYTIFINSKSDTDYTKYQLVARNKDIVARTLAQQLDSAIKLISLGNNSWECALSNNQYGLKVLFAKLP